MQLYGWMRAGSLWPGRVSDSDYNRREGYLQRQQEFQESELVEIDGKVDVLPFLNVYHKGYFFPRFGLSRNTEFDTLK